MTDAPAGRSRERWLVAVAVAAAALPIVVAAIRALANHWVPVGDNAFFSIRSRDVFGANHPLLGTWTSASQSIGVNVNNPGPLMFDWLAIPTKLGAHAGVVVGMALLNLLAVGAIAVFAHRRGGALAVAATMAMAAGLAWTMGPPLLIDPWQPHALLFSFLLVLVLVWSMLRGDAIALPVAAGVTSLILQTHLSYLVLIGGLTVLGVGGLLRAAARERAPTADGPPWWRRLVAPGVATVVILAICWLQPLLQQVFGPGPGNLGRLATHGGSSGSTLGVGNATRVVASVTSTFPFWARPSFRDSLTQSHPQRLVGSGFVQLTGLHSVAVSLLSLVVLAGVLVAVWVVARRRGDSTGAAALVVGAASVALALVGATILPNGILGVDAHQVRWLWPISLFVTGSIGLVLLRPWRYGAPALTAVAVVLGLLALPAYTTREGEPAGEVWAMPVANRLTAQLGSLQGHGPLLFDPTTLAFAEPYSTTVLLDLQRRGIPFVVSDDGWVHQLGEGRRSDGSPTERFFLIQGDAAAAGVPGARRVAYVAGLDARDQRALAASRRELAAIINSDRLRLNERGRRAAQLGEVPTVADFLAGEADTDELVASGEVKTLMERDYVDASGATLRALRTYARLQETWERQTVGVFLAPVDKSAADG